MPRSLVCLACLLLCVADHAEATKMSLYEGQYHGGVSSWPFPYSDGKLCSFRMEAGYMGDLDPARETARVSLSGGSLVKGDSVVTGANVNAHWDIVVRRVGSDPVRVWSSLLVETKDPGTYDFFERMLEVRFQHLRDNLDTVLIVDQRPGRRIFARDGKRYRVGGLYLVAIEDDEREPPINYEKRAEVLSKSDIRCPNCGLKESLEVPVVVTVGSKGNVTWARVEPYRIGAPVGTRPRGAESGPRYPLDPKVWNAIERGLKRFRYRSAIGDGHPVADYATFTVRVVP